MAARLVRLLRGPHLRLPRPLDACSEWWSRRPPRLRMLTAALLMGIAGWAVDARIRAADMRWGGEPAVVFVTTRNLTAGDPAADVQRRRLPPAAVPPNAVTELDPSAVLALPAPRGTVLTGAHLDARGPAAGLDAGMRAVPIPSEPGWGVVDGGWVDVWTLGTGGEPSRLVARGRPVVDVVRDSSGLTSLVGLDADEAQAVTSGLALGRVLLAHAPGPAPDDR